MENFIAPKGLVTLGAPKPPLNVTDIEVGNDGALYFTVGGRAVQAGESHHESAGAVLARLDAGQDGPHGDGDVLRQARRGGDGGRREAQAPGGSSGPRQGRRGARPQSRRWCRREPQAAVRFGCVVRLHHG